MNFDIFTHSDFPLKNNLGIFFGKEELESEEEITGFNAIVTIRINDSYKKNPSILLSEEELANAIYKQAINYCFGFARKSVYYKEFTEKLNKQLEDPALERKIQKFLNGTSLKEFKEGYQLYMSFGNYTPFKANILLAKLYKNQVIKEELIDVI